MKDIIRAQLRQARRTTMLYIIFFLLGLSLLLLLLLLVLILLLLVLLLLVLLLLLLLVLLVLVLVVVTTATILILLVLVLLQLMLSHGEIVAGFIIVGIATQGTLVELNSTLEGCNCITPLLATGSHALCIPDIATVVIVAGLAQRVIRTNGICFFIILESGGVFHLHHVGVAKIVVALEGGVFGNGLQIHRLRFVILLLTIRLVAHANEVAGTLRHHRQHEHHQ